MLDNLKKVGGAAWGALFVAKEPAKVVSEAPINTASVSVSEPAFSMGVPGENKFLDLLKGVLNKESALSNFLKEVETMAEVIPDAAMRFKAVAKMQKVDKTAITLAVQQHLADLQAEQNNFTQFYESARKNATDLIEKSKKDNLDLIAAKNAQIVSLREQISQCEKSIEEINTAQHVLVSEQTTILGKLDQNKMLFTIAYQSVTGSLNSQVSSINSTI